MLENLIKNLIRLVIVVALLALVIAVAPIVFEWITTAIKWIMSQGKLGTIVLTACIIHAVLGKFAIIKL